MARDLVPAQCPIKRSELRLYLRMIRGGDWKPTPEARSKVISDATQTAITGTDRQRDLANQVLAAIKEK